MKKFTKVLMPMLSLFAVFFFVNPCFGKEEATKEECVAKVEDAAKLVKKRDSGLLVFKCSSSVSGWITPITVGI